MYLDQVQDGQFALQRVHEKDEIERSKGAIHQTGVRSKEASVYKVALAVTAPTYRTSLGERWRIRSNISCK